MFKRINEGWQHLLESRPGRRFQDRYHRARRRGNSGLSLGLLVRMATGAVLVVLGLAMLVLPGPGLLVLAAGGAVLASDFLVVARALDTVEILGRRLIERFRRKRRS